MIRTAQAMLDQNGVKLVVNIESAIIAGTLKNTDANTSVLSLSADYSAWLPFPNPEPIDPNYQDANITIQDDANYAETLPYNMGINDGWFGNPAPSDKNYDPNSCDPYMTDPNFYDANTYHVHLNTSTAVFHPAGTVVVRWREFDCILKHFRQQAGMDPNYSGRTDPNYLGRIAGLYVMDDPLTSHTANWDYLVMNLRPVQDEMHRRMEANGPVLPIIWDISFGTDSNHFPHLPFDEQTFDYVNDYVLPAYWATTGTYLKTVGLLDQRNFLIAHNAKTLYTILDYDWDGLAGYFKPKEIDMYNQIICGAAPGANWSAGFDVCLGRPDSRRSK